MLQLEFRGVALSDYLVGVSHAAGVGTGTAHAVGETGVSVDQGCFDLFYGVQVHAVAMDDVLHLKAFGLDLIDTAELGVQFVFAGVFNGSCYVLEYAVVLAASHVNPNPPKR